MNEDNQGNKPVVIFISGHPFSGKTTVAKRFAENHCFHHLDDDRIRHALFPPNRDLEGAERRIVHRYVKMLMLRTAKFNLKKGRSVVISSTSNTEAAKSRVLSFCKSVEKIASIYFFELTVPPATHDSVVRGRMIERFGTDDELLTQKWVHYQYVLSVNSPWPDTVAIHELNAISHVDVVCSEIAANVSEIPGLPVL